MIICHVCAAECEDEAELCPVCGAVLNRPETEEVEEAETILSTTPHCSLHLKI